MTILGLERNGHHPTIVTLDIHLEGDQQFIFNPDTTTSQSVNDSAPSTSKLDAFFLLCSNDSFAATLKYHEVPEYYIWAKREWKRRQIGGPKIPQSDGTTIIHSNAIGRIYSMSPKVGDIYYLRLLLITIPGPTSYSSLKTIDGDTVPTFQESCRRRGLLDNDDHIINAMNEIKDTSPARKLREFFVTILISCEPSDPLSLWNTFVDDLCEDFIMDRRQSNNDFTLGIIIHKLSIRSFIYLHTSKAAIVSYIVLLHYYFTNTFIQSLTQETPSA